MSIFGDHLQISLFKTLDSKIYLYIFKKKCILTKRWVLLTQLWPFEICKPRLCWILVSTQACFCGWAFKHHSGLYSSQDLAGQNRKYLIFWDCHARAFHQFLGLFLGYQGGFGFDPHPKRLLLGLWWRDQDLGGRHGPRVSAESNGDFAPKKQSKVVHERRLGEGNCLADIAREMLKESSPSSQMLLRRRRVSWLCS